MKEEKLRKLAKRRAYARLGFYAHSAAYAFTILPLIGINLAVSPGVPWSVFPALGWGAGLCVHALAVFMFANPGWMRRLVERELRRLKSEQRRARAVAGSIAAAERAPSPGAWMDRTAERSR